MAIIFDTPQQLYPVATKVELMGIHLEDAVLQVNLQWLAADNSLVKSGSLMISGADLTDITDAVILQGYVGLTLGVLFRKAIRQKVKTMLGITGTVT
jgi:hypothetical protein